MLLEVLIAAAASARPLLESHRAAMQRAAGVPVVVRYGATGALARQIENGAPFDLFFGADEEAARALASRGLLERSTLRLYQTGELALVLRPGGAPPAPPRLVDAKWLRALAAGPVRTVAIASPKVAPFGRAAELALRRAGVLEALRPSLIEGGSVEEALQYVASGNADMGLVARPLAERSGLVWARVDGALCAPLRQLAGIVAASPHRGEAARALAALPEVPAASIARPAANRGAESRRAP